MKINQEIMNESLAIAKNILNLSETIGRYNFNFDKLIKDKVDYIKDLVGENGLTSFNPFVAPDLRNEFIKALNENEKFNDDDFPVYCRREYASPLAKSEYEKALTKYVYQFIDDENLVSNTIPTKVMELIMEVDELKKKFSSPKLSKLLVKLWGENSNIVKWYTTKCPKNLNKGMNTDYKINISILPHHIMGMSYYAPINHGGAKWIDGWNDSSCMDTVRNSEGGNIIKLIPNAQDELLAIAFLSKSDDDNFESSYIARMLLKFIKLESGNWIIMGLRAYYTSYATKKILINGMSNQFDNFVHAEEIMSTIRNTNNIQWVNVMQPNLGAMMTRGNCSDCDDDDDCDCHNENIVIYPYIDNSDLIHLYNDKTVITLPKCIVDSIENKINAVNIGA